MLEGRKQSLLLACRDLDVRMGEKRENIGDAGLSTESDETLEKNLNDFDAKLAACVSFVCLWVCSDGSWWCVGLPTKHVR